MTAKENLSFGLLMWGIGISFLGTPAIFAIRLLHWLQFGQWQPWNFATFLIETSNHLPVVEWVGVQKTIDWLIFCEIEWIVFFGGLAVAFLGHGFSDDS